MIKKPFILFSGETYYPAPGWKDYISDFETLEGAIQTGKQSYASPYGWWQVVDLNLKKVVAGEGEGETGLCGMEPAGIEEVENEKSRP